MTVTTPSAEVPVPGLEEPRTEHGSRRLRHLTAVPDARGGRPAQHAWDAHDMASVWAASRAGDRGARDHLLVQHHRLVARVATRLHGRLGRHHELGDLVCAGVFGLIDAVEKFDPDRGHPFEAYAAARIRGAILDDVRASDWAPRSVRTQTRDIDTARAELEAALHRHPTHAEVAAHLGVKPRHLSRTLADDAALRVAALDEPRIQGMTLAEFVAQPGADPAEQVEHRADRRLLADALEAVVDDRVKLVLVLYYFERMPLADIASILGVTVSRVSQLHHVGLRTLRVALERARAA